MSCCYCSAESSLTISEDKYICEDCLEVYIQDLSRRELKHLEKHGSRTYYCVAYNSLCSSGSDGTYAFFTSRKHKDIFKMAKYTILKHLGSQCQNYEIRFIERLIGN